MNTSSTTTASSQESQEKCSICKNSLRSQGSINCSALHFSTAEQEPEWEKEFDEKFIKLSLTIKNSNGTLSDISAATTIKSFIKSLLTTEREKYDEDLKWIVDSHEMLYPKVKEIAKKEERQRIIEYITKMKEEELSAKPSDEVEETAEWYKVMALNQILSHLTNKE